MKVRLLDRQSVGFERMVRLVQIAQFWQLVSRGPYKSSVISQNAGVVGGLAVSIPFLQTITNFVVVVHSVQ